MDIQTDKAYMIFRRPYEDRVYYSVGLSKKNASGGYDKGYMPVQFKRDVDIPDQTKIYIRHAWISFYTKKKSVNGTEYTETVPYIFINEFVTMEDRIKETHIDIPDKDEDLFAEFGNEITITDDDLPF